MPSRSPGRGARVVAETDSSNSPSRSIKPLIKVPLPTPEGPVITNTRATFRTLEPGAGERSKRDAQRRSSETNSLRWRSERPPIVLLGEIRQLARILFTFTLPYL